MTNDMLERLRVRQVIEDWAVYRHLAYLQTKIGFTVKREMPMLKGPAVDRLYARGAAWLAGQSFDN